MLQKIMLVFLSLFTNKKIIILESHSDYCDSTKTLFDKMISLELNKKYKIFWLVDDPKSLDIKYKFKNVKFISITSVRSKFIRAIAGFSIYTHREVGNPYNKKQKSVFITHGAMPIKNSSGQFGDPHRHTFILGTSELCINFRKKVLGESDNYVVTGLPRNDDLFLSITDEIKMLTNNKKYIIWMPTFKHHKGGVRNDFGVNTDNDISLLNEDNINFLNEILTKEDVLLILKPHPAQDLRFLNLYSKSNVISVTNNQLNELNINLYALLGHASALITDFSSVFIDYLLCDKPIAFELGDMEQYKKGIGYVMDNPEDYMIGDKIFTINDFAEFIIKVSKGIDEHKIEREKLCSLLHFYKDNSSSQRVLDLLNIK